jgi:hypothetical protein
MSAESRQAFAAFREKALDNHALMVRLHRPMERDAYIARLVRIGAEEGFAFEEADVRAVMGEGQLTWLSQGMTTL